MSESFFQKRSQIPENAKRRTQKNWSRWDSKPDALVKRAHIDVVSAYYTKKYFSIEIQAEVVQLLMSFCASCELRDHNTAVEIKKNWCSQHKKFDLFNSVQFFDAMNGHYFEKEKKMRSLKKIKKANLTLFESIT